MVQEKMIDGLIHGQKVRLTSFNGSVESPDGCQESENYWKAVGYVGVIVETKNSRGRVLVQFDRPIKALGLHCHNPIENALYILASDLTVVA
jgi:hypothetical protein